MAKLSHSILTTALVGILSLGSTGVSHAAQGDRIATISGALTELSSVQAVTADKSGKIYVANAGTGQILVFASNANGDVAPINRISDQDGFIDGLNDVEVSANGTVYAASDSGILIFAPGTAGNVSPSRMITSIPARGIAVGQDRKIYAVSGLGWSIYVFAANADGADEPVAILPWDEEDPFKEARDVAVDNTGAIYVPSYKSPRRIMVWSPGYDSGDTPDREIARDTGLDDPAGIDVDCATGDLVLSNSDDNEILLFNSDDPITASGSVIESGYEAQGLGFGLSSNLYIADSDNSAIYVVEWDTSCQLAQSESSEGLAPTGADSNLTVVVTSILAGVGALALVLRRRRRA